MSKEKPGGAARTAIEARKMSVNLTIGLPMLREMDAIASERGMTRSGLMVQLIEKHLLAPRGVEAKGETK